MANRHTTIPGIGFGIVAGAAWGLAFLIPTVLSSFSSLEITLGRYLMYGLYSLLMFFLYKKNPWHIPSKVWLRALLYAFTGNIGYFFFLVLGIQYAGTTVTTLIIGTLPMTISLCGNLLNREFPFRIMLLPSCSILLGIFLLYWVEQGGTGYDPVSRGDFVLGILFCVIAVALWTWYGVSNAHFLKKEPGISADLFATIIGIQTLVLVLLSLIAASIANQPIVSSVIFHDAFFHYLIGVLALGIVASWVATWAWNQTSKRLPVTLAGMMIVFETCFGLLYSYLYFLVFSTALEWGSILLIVSGVTAGIWRSNSLSVRTKKM